MTRPNTINPQNHPWKIKNTNLYYNFKKTWIPFIPFSLSNTIIKFILQANQSITSLGHKKNSSYNSTLKTRRFYSDEDFFISRSVTKLNFILLKHTKKNCNYNKMFILVTFLTKVVALNVRLFTENKLWRYLYISYTNISSFLLITIWPMQIIDWG